MELLTEQEQKVLWDLASQGAMAERDWIDENPGDESVPGIREKLAVYDDLERRLVAQRNEEQIVITDPTTDEGLVVTRRLVEELVNGKRVAVLFKDEDEDRGVPIGPVTIWDLDIADPSTPYPFGEEPAARLMNLGWLAKPDALRVAEWARVELES